MSDVFDCTKGYSDTEYPSNEEEAQNAYYQGFITDWERQHLVNGNAVINHENELVWLKHVIGYEHILVTSLLTKERMIMIQADHLLGIGDGNTLAPVLKPLNKD